MKRFINIQKIKIVNYVFQTNYSSFLDEVDRGLILARCDGVVHWAGIQWPEIPTWDFLTRLCPTESY